MPKITEPLIDNRGTTIEPGLTVAYNFSGEIAVGVVKSVSPAIKDKDDWHYIKRASIKIEIQHPIRQRGNISNVRDPKNVMVIKEIDEHS